MNVLKAFGRGVSNRLKESVTWFDVVVFLVSYRILVYFLGE
jgi:hypothetical protein